MLLLYIHCKFTGPDNVSDRNKSALNTSCIAALILFRKDMYNLNVQFFCHCYKAHYLFIKCC